MFSGECSTRLSLLYLSQNRLGRKLYQIKTQFKHVRCNSNRSFCADAQSVLIKERSVASFNLWELDLKKEIPQTRGLGLGLGLGKTQIFSHPSMSVFNIVCMKAKHLNTWKTKWISPNLWFLNDFLIVSPWQPAEKKAAAIQRPLAVVRGIPLNNPSTGQADFSWSRTSSLGLAAV